MGAPAEDPGHVGSGTEKRRSSWETEPSGARSISLRSTEESPEAGQRIRLKGRIRADLESCSPLERVALKVRKPGKTFHKIDETLTTGTGRYSFRVTVRKDRDYRTVTPAVGFCERARSKVVKIRPG